MSQLILIRRAAAYLIDILLVFVVVVGVTQTTVFVPIRRLFIGSDNWFKSGWNTEFYTLLTISLPVWLYFALFELTPWQATPGKRLLKLQTVDKNTENRITPVQAVIRMLVKLLPWEIAHLANNLPAPIWYDPNPGFRIGFIVAPLLILVSVVLAAVTPGGHSLHDLAAKTVVIRTDYGTTQRATGAGAGTNPGLGSLITETKGERK